MKRVWLPRGALVAALAGIAWLSLRPVGDSTLDRAVAACGNGYLHLPAYAVLAGLFIGVLGWTPRRILASGVGAAAYGWLLEVAQRAVPTRHFNLRGLALDAAGAAFACLSALAVRAVVARRSARRRGPA